MIKKKLTLEDLAAMVQHGFAETALKVDTATKEELLEVKKRPYAKNGRRIFCRERSS